MILNVLMTKVVLSTLFLSLINKPELGNVRYFSDYFQNIDYKHFLKLWQRSQDKSCTFIWENVIVSNNVYSISYIICTFLYCEIFQK